MHGYRRPSSTPLSMRRGSIGSKNSKVFGDSAHEDGAGEALSLSATGVAAPRKYSQASQEPGSPCLIIKSFTPSPAPSTSPRAYGRGDASNSHNIIDQAFAEIRQRPSTTGSYTSTSSRLKQKNKMLAFQQQARRDVSMPRGPLIDTLVEESSFDVLPSEPSSCYEDDFFFLNTADVQRVEKVVVAWLHNFGEDIAPYFPHVARKREFGMRVLNVFLERHLLKESKSHPNTLVTSEDKCTSTMDEGASYPNSNVGYKKVATEHGAGNDPMTSQSCGTQTIVHRDLNEAKILEQNDEIETLRSKIQKLNEHVKKQKGHLTLRELDQAKMETEIKDLKNLVNNCWCCSNPAFHTPEDRSSATNMAHRDQRPNTSMGFIRSKTPKQLDSDGIPSRQVNVNSVPAKSLESKFNQSNNLDGTLKTGEENLDASFVSLKGAKDVDPQRDRVRREIKERNFQGGGTKPVFGIQLKATQTLNKKLRTELVTLRKRVQEMVNYVDDENSKSVQSLMDTKEKLQCRMEKVEVSLHMKHEINDRVAKEVQKRIAQAEEDVKVLMKQQEDELVKLKKRLHTETREKRKQLTSARKENEKKEELIILSQDDRIKRLKFQIQSKEHTMMQKHVLMERENMAVIQELEEKCSQADGLAKENHQLREKIVKLEEEMKMEQHKFNLQGIDLDDIKLKASKEIEASTGLKNQCESLKADLQEARSTAEDYINKFNAATYQVEQVEKSKWFMDKHMKRLKRDIDELEEQHKATTNELIQMRSQCSYLLRDNSHMKVAVNEATKSIVSCNNFFYLINDKVALCENTVDNSNDTLAVLGNTLDKDQIRLANEYKALCKTLESQLEETEKELSGTKSSTKTMNESIKQVSLSHAKRGWEESHMDYENYQEEFRKEKSRQLVEKARIMQSDSLVEAAQLDAETSLGRILSITRDSQDIRTNLGEECIRIATTNRVGSTLLDNLGAFYDKLFKDFDNLMLRTDKKLKSFERKEVTLRKKVINYSEGMKALRINHNREVHEKNKKLRDIDKSLSNERMKVEEQNHSINEMKEEMASKKKEVGSLKLSVDAAKSKKESLTKDLTLLRIKAQKLESEVVARDKQVQDAQMATAEYQVQVNVNNKKFDQRVIHFKNWFGLASESLSQGVTSIKEDFNSMQDDILHELMRNKTWIDYELNNENSFLSKLKVKDWSQQGGKK